MHRLEAGEGIPRLDTPWANITFAEGEPFPPTRRPPPEVLWRNFYYRRIRSSAECDRHMRLEPRSRPRPAFQLTTAWINPTGGVIPIPSDADQRIPFTHAAVFIGRIPDSRRFHFELKWRDWGDHGTGYMPYEYFDKYVFECWAAYGGPGVLRVYKFQKLDADGRVRWSAHDEEDHRIYAFEVRDPRSDERRAWAFVIEREAALEVEELYVRPEYRRMGHGRWLADRVAQLAREKRMPLRLWIAFADCKVENENNYLALVSTARRIGVEFQTCAVPWAAYFATTEKPGTGFPVEPIAVPGRPRAPRNAVQAFVLAMASIATVPKDVPSSVGPDPGVAIAVPTEDKTLDIDSEEWGELIRRRCVLISKKNRQGLNEEERIEYERLERIVDSTMQRAFPPQVAWDEKIAAVESQLGGGSDQE
jgi:GNAT superfamily N-acetyltransferase